VAQPHAAYARGGYRQPPLFQLVSDTNLPKGWLLNRERHDGIFDLLRHAVLQHRLLAADLLQRQLTTLVVQFLEPVEAVPAIAHHLACLTDVAELLGKL
jgi:hypothetical protein